MTERPKNEEREALIAGDRFGELDPAEEADLARFADLLADPSTWAEPGSGLEDAVIAAVLDAPVLDAPVLGTPVLDAPAVASALTVVDERADAPRGGSVPRGPARRRPRIVLSALAAAAAIAIVIGTVAVVRRDPKAAFTSRLSATALAPGARGAADVYRNRAGFHVELDAKGLPELAAGSYYEAWLKRADGTLVAIGTFSSSDGKITLWSGVSPRDFPTLTVTIEATDNDQSSSGRVVLAGPVDAR